MNKTNKEKEIWIESENGYLNANEVVLFRSRHGGYYLAYLKGGHITNIPYQSFLKLKELKIKNQ